MKNIKVLSLFDGISCGMVAFDQNGWNVTRYDAYEVEENAIKVSEYNYPNIEHKGDVFKAVYKEGEFDIVIGGSPCTHWSIAKAGNGRETTSSGIGWELFNQYVRAINEVKPKYFLYENNESMSDSIKEAISRELGVDPIMIDSKDFSAQNRKRYYWTNIPVDMDWDKSELVLRDIIYKEEKYNIKDFSKYANTVKWNKDRTVCSWDTSGKGYYSQGNRCRTIDVKSNTLTASGNDKNNIFIDEYKCRILNPIEAERLQTLPDGYTNCLKSRVKRSEVCGNGWTVEVIKHLIKNITI